jgi:hypothetical protein
MDALALTVYDEAHSQNEDRWFTQTAGGLTWACCCVCL